MTARAVRSWATTGGGTWLAFAFVLCACPAKPPPPPELQAVSPDRLLAGTDGALHLTGHHLHARIRADLDARAVGEGSAAVTLPEVWLSRNHDDGTGDGAAPIALQVLELGAEGLRLAVPGLSEGRYDLSFRDGWGRTSTLPRALRVVACLEDAACDDGRSCTMDRCEDGACAHAVADGFCAVASACVAAGPVGDGCQACDPGWSQVALVPAPSGTACDDGRACTDGDVCQAGACGGVLRECPGGSACAHAACDEETGACVTRPKADGTACDDGNTCTGPDACAGGGCGGQPVCGNTPPRGCLGLSPVASRVGEPVTFDARCAEDLEDAPVTLQFRFDFDGDGIWDTPFAAEAVAQTTAQAPGVFRAAVQVQDPGGLSGFASRHWSVGTQATDVEVTTGVDEADLAATPAAPGGTGLSLREALTFANGPGGVGVERIRFAPGVVPVQAALPAVTRPGLQMVGEPGLTLDFSPAAADGPGCLVLGGDGQRLVGLAVAGCPGTSVTVDDDGEGVALWDVRLEGPGEVGADVKGAGAQLGPGLAVSGFSARGLNLRAANVKLAEADVHHNGVGVRQQHPGSVAVARTLIRHNAGSGVEVHNLAGLAMRACTVHGNGGDGLRPQPNTTGLVVVNSLFTDNGGAGVAGPVAAFTLRTPNGYFNNAAGPLQTGIPGAQDLLGAPGYTAPPLGDYCLRPDALAVDRGLFGAGGEEVDHNGPRAGTYDGLAPDLGACESPWTGTAP